MAYCTQAYLEDAHSTELIRELTDDAATGSIISARVTQSIGDADSVVDGYLRVKYDVPLSPVPSLVKKISGNLTMLFLYERRAAVFSVPDWVNDAADRAYSMLRDMRDGKLDLGVEPPSTVSTGEAATYDGPDRLFTSDTLEYF